MKRAILLAIAVTAWFALLLQFAIVLTSEVNQTLSPAERVIRYFSFFTVLTNLIVAFTTTAISLFPNSRCGSFASKPSTQAAVATYISIVGIVYSLFLRSVWDPVGWQAVADHALHDVVPLAFVLYWVTLAPKDGIGWVAPFRWLVYPILYMAYSLLRGAISGWYPYWFVDVTQIGYRVALTNSLMVLLAFLLVGLIFATLSRLLRPAAIATKL